MPPPPAPFARPPLLAAVAQLDDPAFTGVVWRSLLLSAAVFATLAWVGVWGVEWMVGLRGWWGWLASVLGGLASALLALWLFVPAAVVIATLFIERVAAAVDRRYYPWLPEPRGESVAVQTWDGVALGARVLALQVMTLVLAVLLPGVGLVLGWLIAGWAVGRGLFVAVAMRRMSRLEAQGLYERRRLAVLAQGVLLALAGTVPLVNLLVPVLGTAAMVHVLNRSYAAPLARPRAA